jgi:lysosomal alpha-mannosidase
MPDEATTYYRDLITNGELGMKFLENEFGECGRPLVAWQIDPFGHSRGVAKVYEKMGFDALFLGRIDYLDYKNRTEHKEMEFDWIEGWKFRRKFRT